VGIGSVVQILFGLALIIVASIAMLSGGPGTQTGPGILSVAVGFVFGVIMLASAALKTSKRRAAARSGSVGTGSVASKCPRCGKDISGEFVVCPYCGLALKARCPSCGKPLKEDFAVCPSCGQNLKEAGTTGSEPSAPAVPETRLRQVRPRGGKRKAGIAALVALVIIGGFVTVCVLQEGPRVPAPAFSVTPDREQGISPVVVKYPGRDGKPRSAYSVAGRITIIAKQGVSPEAVRDLVSKLGGAVRAEIPDAGVYFTRGFDGRESEVVAALYRNRDIVDCAFPTPPGAAKVLAVEDFKTLMATDGRYLHFDIGEDGRLRFFWTEDRQGALTHGQLVSLLAGIRKGSGGAIDCAVRDESSNEIWMDTEWGLQKAAEMARKERDQGRITVMNNSWGAPFPEVPQGASAADLKEKTEAFVTAEANAYRMLLKFLEANPNVVAVKSIGNEGVDLSKALAEARGEGANVWKRLLLVGAVDDNLLPTKYSNRAVGFTTGILWVPELKDVDGDPVPGTSFTAPQVSALMDRIARERPDLSPEQVVAVLFDQRVSPRVNLRPTIKDPLSTETLNKALEVAAERFPPSKGASAPVAKPSAPGTAAKPSVPGPAAKPAGARVQVFPATAKVNLESGALLLRAVVDGVSIGKDNDKYAVEWYLGGTALISREPWLTTEPFAKAIGGREGTYLIKLVVKDRASGALVGEGTARVTAEKSKKISLGPSRWVSATPGKGMKYWFDPVNTEKNLWFEADVELQVQGSKGTLAFTVTSVYPSSRITSGGVSVQILPEPGTRGVWTFDDWKDDGKTVTFSVKDERGLPRSYTFRLTRTPDGHLRGNMTLPYFDPEKHGMKIQIAPGAVLAMAPGAEAELDLVPAPR
jgi:hypothetical protein